jgi:Winged helix DNA-binding domain
VDFLVERMTRQGLTRQGPTRQGLARQTRAGAAQVAASAVGLQAQDSGAARLGMRARSSGLDEADVVKACEVERSVVRTWLMRATVHLVAAEDVRWMVALFGPMIERRFANVRWRQLGIDERLIETATGLACQVLKGRQLTRHELAAELVDRGIRLAADGQAATHLLLALSCRGITCRATERGRESTFALLDEWIPSTPAPTDHGAELAPTDPSAELARRYFRAFGPATAADFTTWSGLPSGAAIKAIRDELTEVEFEGRRGWTLGAVEPVKGLRLLPMFDNYLIGYRDRTAMLDPALHAKVYVGGIIKATVVRDGRVIGIWRLDRSGRSATIRITPFEPISQQDQLERERADIERFLGRAVGLTVEG